MWCVFTLFNGKAALSDAIIKLVVKRLQAFAQLNADPPDVAAVTFEASDTVHIKLKRRDCHAIHNLTQGTNARVGNFTEKHKRKVKIFRMGEAAAQCVRFK